MGTLWEDEARKALYMELIEQHDRLRDKRRRDAGCRCGSCDIESIKTFDGKTVATIGVGPCFQPVDSWRSPSGQLYVHAQPRGGAGDSGATRPTWYEPPPPIFTASPQSFVTVSEEVKSAPEPAPEPPSRELEVAIWRSRAFGWHGALYEGTVQLLSWWRPFKRYAEWRGSYVWLREIEHREREVWTLG